MDTKMLNNIKTHKTVIYGAGNIARLAITYLKSEIKNFEEQIAGCAVSSKKRISTGELENLPIRTIDEYLPSKDELFFLVAANPRFLKEIEDELRERKISRYAFFDCEKCKDFLELKWKENSKARYEDFRKNLKKDVLSSEEYYTFLGKQLKKTLNFEINVAEHCNLNCQSCNHFSPLAKEIFLRTDRLEKDLQRISSLYGDDIGNVMLLGGEPLLHPEINEVLCISRKFLPHASISLVTNGLLLAKMDEDFWRLMKELDISLNVTVYPIKFDYEKYERKARECGIKNNFDHSSLGGRSEIVKTTYLMPIRDVPAFNPYEMYARCEHANFCVALKEGRIYSCSFASNIHHYNEYFHKNIPESEEVSINIYENGRKEIDEYLKSPNKMCSHCDICGYKYDIPWRVSEKRAEEWIGETAEI